ncbi:hypothetical protein GYMLUDRAFT_780606 [Collybiopsis luxurians FD-317 M1]|uniref:SPX domain-containing protein n=1 Tax=Collybiopsis luxurians FD-317 M1 TaxID=944289 RepID=A0A0D0CF17_9AGAR|nr:hypothetical protein GYMLUDRAFT_780606 [Collybiopsis luxurians FD-317 M1]
MKFAKYLSQTQTPEWKKAYIDYRGLKKKIRKEKPQHLATESQVHLPASPETSHFPGEQADGGPSTSRARHDAGMGLGELPVRKRSVATRRGSQSSAPDSSQSSSHRKLSVSGAKGPRSQTSRGFLARGTPLFAIQYFIITDSNIASQFYISQTATLC